MPAAAVIPALVAYTKIVEVKRLAVECLLKSVDGSRRWAPLKALVSLTSFLVFRGGCFPVLSVPSRSMTYGRFLAKLGGWHSGVQSLFERVYVFVSP